MTVESEQLDGQQRIRLGPVERRVAALGLSALIFLVGWIFWSVTGRLDKQGDAINELVKQQAVTNAQLTTLSAQLADVPGLTRQMAELKVRVDRHDEDLRELRSIKGLK